MTAQGIWVVSHQPKRIATHGPLVLDDLTRNLAQAALRPRPAIRAIPSS